MPRPAAPPSDPVCRQYERTMWVSRFLVILLCLCMIGLMSRVIQLRYWPSDQLRAEAGLRLSSMTMLGRRGQITDRLGRVLSSSHIGYRLFVDPQMIQQYDFFALRLATAIGDDPARIDELIGTHAERRYVVIDKLLTEEQRAAVRALDLPGVGLEQRLVRTYPAGNLAGQVIGFVGAEDSGLEGLEFKSNQQLTGEQGKLRYVRDVRRQPVWVSPSGYHPDHPGEDVVLSLDSVIQRIAEEELATVGNHYKAESAEAIVLEPSTGQILAMANWPPFDPDHGGNVKPDHRRNRAVTDAFEPGSIFKSFVFAAATAEHVATPNEKIDCSDQGYHRFDFGRTLHDAHASGTLTWDGVLIKSSNIGMGIVGLRLGTDRMYSAVRQFGFGSATGSGLPGESPGIVNPRKSWTSYSLTSIPMGQEIAVTPLQMVTAFSAFANGGVVALPSIYASDREHPIYRPVIDAATADHVRTVLRRVVTEGTGRYALSDRYQIWGKTGTAQVPSADHRGYIPDAYTASFICGAPLRDPRVIVIVVVHRPDKSIGHYGGIVASPPAKAIVEKTLAYLAVPPDVEATDPDHPASPVRLADFSE